MQHTVQSTCSGAHSYPQYCSGQVLIARLSCIQQEPAILLLLAAWLSRCCAAMPHALVSIAGLTLSCILASDNVQQPSALECDESIVIRAQRVARSRQAMLCFTSLTGCLYVLLCVCDLLLQCICAVFVACRKGKQRERPHVNSSSDKRKRRASDVSSSGAAFSP